MPGAQYTFYSFVKWLEEQEGKTFEVIDGVLTPVSPGSAAVYYKSQGESLPGQTGRISIGYSQTDPPTDGTVGLTIVLEDGGHLLTLPFDCDAPTLDGLLAGEFGAGIFTVEGGPIPNSLFANLGAGHSLLPIISASLDLTGLVGGTDLADVTGLLSEGKEDIVGIGVGAMLITLGGEGGGRYIQFRIANTDNYENNWSVGLVNEGD